MNHRPPFWFALAILAAVTVSCSGARPVLLTEAGPITTSTTVQSTVATEAAPVEVPLTEADCVTASGTSWQVTIEATAEPSVACLLLAGHQRVEFVNNTSDMVSFDLAGLSASIEPAATFTSEPAGTFLQPGLTELNATPHPISGLWLVDPGQRALLGQPVGLNSLGPVSIGSSPTDFQATIDGRTLPTTDAPCYVTSLVGDPYSPLFTVANGTVSVIQVFSPGQLTRSEIGVGSSEGDVLAAYGQQIESQPAPDGNPESKLLVFVPSDDADKQYRLVFVVDNGIVASLRTGLTDAALNNPACG
jgi:hypothetical protein